jgi:hypothetical protein
VVGIPERDIGLVAWSSPAPRSCTTPCTTEELRDAFAALEARRTTGNLLLVS